VSTPGIALIGCGAVAETYYVPALRKRPDLLRSLILVDPDLGRASALRERLGALDAVADYREALPRVRGALVLTPHRLHHGISLDCLRQGIAVLCEKPLAETAAEVDEIIEASRRHAAPVLVNHTRRLFSSHREVRKLIETGALGELREIRYELGAPFEWPAATPNYFGAGSGGRGVLFDSGVHVVDLVCWWLGGEPQVLDYADDSRGGTEAVARLRVRRGAVDAHMRFSWLSKLQNAYRVEGTRATVEGGAYDWSSFTLTEGGRSRKVRTDRSWRVYEHFVERLLDNFAGVMAGRAEPLVCAADVRPAIAVIDACYGRRAPLDEPWHDAWRRLFPDERRVANG
jgi:predicted dehydrogenase